MNPPQAGIFALGTASHAYLELDLAAGRNGPELVVALAVAPRAEDHDGRRQPRRRLQARALGAAAPDDALAGLEGFNEDMVGTDDYTMPATQHDAVLWLSGSAYDVVFDTARAAIAELAGLASVAEETSSWPYRHDLDLTGFIDGTREPDARRGCPTWCSSPTGSRARAARSCCCRSGRTMQTPGSRSVIEVQEAVIGRRKADSEELDPKARRLARREHRPGRVREDLPPEHALRHRHRPRDDVRRLLQRASDRSRRCSRAWPA